MMTIDKLNDLTEKDTYSLIMFALYKLKDDPKYSTLSELTYLLDKNSLMTMLEYFGGMTITIPSIQELRELFNALVMYNDVKIEKTTSLARALKDLEKKGYDKNKIINCFNVISNVLDTYEFGDREQ